LKQKKNKIKVGDWVRVRIVGFGSDEPSYKVESIENDIYVIVQKEGSYKHRMTIKEDKIKKL
jgi:DNA-directed RNA polymerase subunit E'/Rpb7